MKNILTAILIGLASLVSAQSYDTNGMATVTLASGTYTITKGSNDLAWSYDGITFDTNWPTDSVVITNNLYLQGIPESSLTTLETPVSTSPAFFIPVTFTSVPSYGVIRVPADKVDAAIVMLKRQANIQANIQLSSSNVSKIILLNNDDGTWIIKCDPK